jgi:hypothetical protein
MDDPVNVGLTAHPKPKGNHGIRRRYTMKLDVSLYEVQNQFVFLWHMFKQPDTSDTPDTPAAKLSRKFLKV